MEHQGPLQEDGLVVEEVEELHLQQMVVMVKIGVDSAAAVVVLLIHRLYKVLQILVVVVVET
jgi:hypothetical protein